MHVILVPGFWLDGRRGTASYPGWSEPDSTRIHSPSPAWSRRAPTAPRSPSRTTSAPNLQELGRLRDVEYVDLPTGHWPQFSKPDDLAAVIAKAVIRPARSASAQG